MTKSYPKTALPVDQRTLRSLFWGIVSIAIFTFIHFAFFTDVWPNPDGRFSFSSTSLSLYIAVGRWGLALYRYIFGSTMSPWSCSLMAGLYLTAAVLIQISLFRLKPALAKITYIVVSFASLQFAEMMVWRMQSDAVALGLLLSTLSVRSLIRDPSKKSLAVAIALLVPAIAIYQTIVWHYVILLALLLFSGKIRHDKRPDFSFLAKGGLIVILSVALSILAGKAIVCLFPVPEELALLASNYHHQLNIWEVSREHQSNAALLARIYAHNIKEYLFESVGCHPPISRHNNFLHNASYVTTLSLIPTLALAISIFRSNRSRAQKRILSLLLLFIFLFPYTPVLIMTSRICRSFLADPPAHAFIWALCAANISHEKFKKGLLFLLAFIVVKSSYAVSISEERRKIYYMNYALHLYLTEFVAIQQAGPEITTSKDRNILIVAGQKMDDISAYPLYKKLRRATTAEEEKYAKDIETMGEWPQKTSIRTVDDHVLIKM